MNFFKATLTLNLLIISANVIAQTFSIAPSLAVANNTTETSVIAVSGVGNLDCLTKLSEVCIDLTHTRDRDLDIYLIDPAGVYYELTTDNGATGDHYTNTCFSMTAVTNVTAGTAPFTGSYIPEGDLDLANNGQDADGNWTLEVTDDAGGPSGTLNSWSITFAADVSSVSGDYVVLEDAVPLLPDCVTLTSNTTDQRGCVWDVSSTLNFAADFSYDFIVNLGSDDAGADGVAFVIQNDPAGLCACGDAGGALGAGGIDNSLIIEVDTYINPEDRDDGPSMDAAGLTCLAGTDPDHLDIWENGNVNPAGVACPGSPGARIITSAEPLMSGGALYNVENGSDHILRIAWDAGTTTLTASLLDDVAVEIFATVTHTFSALTLFGTETPYFGITAATGGLSNEQTFCNSPILLAVRLVDFEVFCSKNGAQINWTTVTEVDNKHFTVMRSTNGEDYYPIGVVDGHGNSSEEISYRFVDNDVPNGKVYYTLKQTDFDGIETYTGIVSVIDCKIEDSFSLYPNPLLSGSELVIVCEKKYTDGVVTIVNAQGSVVLQVEMEEQNGEMRLPILLVSGLYHVIITDSKGEIYKSEQLIIAD